MSLAENLLSHCILCARTFHENDFRSVPNAKQDRSKAFRSEMSYLHVIMAVSLAGMALLPLFGLILHFQPDFVHGLHVDSSTAERNCYIAAGCYCVTFLTSGVALWLHKRAASAESTDALPALCTGSKKHTSARSNELHAKKEVQRTPEIAKTTQTAELTSFNDDDCEKL